MRQWSEGSAPDGSPVGLYAVLPSMGEAELVHDSVAAGSSILELGCGAGRMTRALLGLGHPVVAVDESPEMLALVEGAETVLGDIDSLRLQRHFDVVLLASQLINTASERQRRARLRTARVHLERDGRLVLQRMDPRWLDPHWAGLRAGRHRLGSHAWSTTRDVKLAPPAVSATIVYQVGRASWTHRFTCTVLDDDGIAMALAAAGLEWDGWLDPDRTWLAATLTRRRGAGG